MESVTRSWLVWQLTGSPFWLGLMIFFHWLPTTTLSLFAGVLADRVDNRKLIMYCEGLYLFSALTVGILTLTGLVQVWQISILLILHGLSGAISNPSRQVFIHETVGRDRLMSAVSLTDSMFQCMTFVGPAVAGLFIAAVGPGLTYMVISGAFVPAVIIMAIIRLTGESQGRPARASAWRSMADGLGYVRRSQVMLSMLALATVQALLIGDSVSAMMPVFATQVLHIGAEGMGFLLSAYGLGAILAALFISYMGGIRHKGVVVIFTAFAFGVFLASFSQSSSYFLSMALLFAAGMCGVASQTMINVSLQLTASDGIRGRVMGLYSMGTLGVRSFNGPLIGTFASAIGAPIALGILGGIVAVCVIINAALTPDRWHLD